MNSPEDNNKERPVTTPPDPSTALILPRPKISAFPVRRSEPQAGAGKFLKDGVISVESARFW